ncbi:hypothetical protein OESDEN_06531 [Oesophagostomum dentatum]|uniref:Uncharacterized protein n=1 Tax=Oesophagostomum dentatum TaxID=61180 RepID=A0A0B1T8I3_OESDE|nr:hypothetical protein OESDEN_06531 [Oesophagostomum dentatum]
MPYDRLAAEVYSSNLLVSTKISSFTRCHPTFAYMLVIIFFAGRARLVRGDELNKHEGVEDSKSSLKTILIVVIIVAALFIGFMIYACRVKMKKQRKLEASNLLVSTKISSFTRCHPTFAYMLVIIFFAGRARLVRGDELNKHEGVEDSKSSLKTILIVVIIVAALFIGFMIYACRVKMKKQRKLEGTSRPPKGNTSKRNLTPQ